MVRKSKDAEFICEYEIKDHKIMTMEEEKRERVIAAALKEFNKGYHSANIDEIIKEAGISKGLIFHYFGSKRGLFLFLLKYSAEIINNEYAKVILSSRDFLENVWEVSKLAMEMTLQYPIMYGFIGKAVFVLNEIFPEGLPKDIPNSNEGLLQEILKKSDRSFFRDDIDRDKAQNVALWTMKGFSDSLLAYGDDLENYNANLDKLMKEFEEYVELLRKLLYK
ncbi:TetR/AcrR family transcriptional regulator [Geosporobacter ferrireducens]|uniref:TetR/AcrR family transcriptional regulator n=1 Tax=Geosporobacter ferrireducens TaxID=1424294 RepID=UPI00139BC74F|nr:TetR/AcrR family transcriptional regulator [Geosporobacter ferrireducens]MTI56416.1 TetR family transcriptional regulator [Geosporobacter ferrireducens]